MIISVINQQDSLRFSSGSVKKIVEHVLHLEGIICHEVTIHFVDTPTMCQVHEEYFNDPTTTDCMSFPVDEDSAPYRVLGDVMVCPETAVHYGQAHDIDPYRETTLYIVHGLLHLSGFDDIDPEDQKVMRQAEQKHMTSLEKHGLILSMSPTC